MSPELFEAVSGGETTDQLLSGCPSTAYWRHRTSSPPHPRVRRQQPTSTAGRPSSRSSSTRLTTPSGPDHGLPAGLPCSEYLDASRDLLGYDGEAHEQAVIEHFGAYTIPFVIDIGNFCLFSTRPA
jgi:hypothetical protein